MPQHDRHRTRIVPIEFKAHEEFASLPLPERVTLVLITSGKASFVLNGKVVALTAPCMLLLSQCDQLQITESARLAAKSFSFKPTFILTVALKCFPNNVSICLLESSGYV